MIIEEDPVSRLIRYIKTLSRKSPIQFAIIGASGLWLAFSFFDETLKVLYHPFYRVESGWQMAVGYTLIALIISFGITLPLLSLLFLYRGVDHHMKRIEKPLSFHKAFYKGLVFELHGNAGILLFLSIFIFPFYLLVEVALFPVSVVPLVTPLSAIFVLSVGYLIVKQVETEDRITALAISTILILATKYVDLNPNKPLLRAMYRIKIGMTAKEVDKVMGDYKYGHGGPENFNWEEDRDKRDVLVYVPYNSADIVKVGMRDGRVEEISFSGD